MILQLFQFLQTFLVQFGLLCALVYITVSLGNYLRINTLGIICVELSFLVGRLRALIVRWNAACQFSDLERIQFVLEVFNGLFLTILQGS